MKLASRPPLHPLVRRLLSVRYLPIDLYSRYAGLSCFSRFLSHDLILMAMRLGNRFDVARYARVDLGMIVKLPTESCDL
jgi:hypothetical protein